LKIRYNPWLLLYGIAMIVIAGVFIIILFRIAFLPLCVSNSQGVCPVDGGSILSFSGGMLALAAALLTFIAGPGVAYWWARLDERVQKQVDQQINQKLLELDDKLQKYTNQKMVEQNKDIVEAFNEQKKILVGFRDEVEADRQRLDDLRERAEQLNSKSLQRSENLSKHIAEMEVATQQLQQLLIEQNERIQYVFSQTGLGRTLANLSQLKPSEPPSIQEEEKQEE
jgi:hypothetical protein